MPFITIGMIAMATFSPFYSSAQTPTNESPSEQAYHMSVADTFNVFTLSVKEAIKSRKHKQLAELLFDDKKQAKVFRKALKRKSVSIYYTNVDGIATVPVLSFTDGKAFMEAYNEDENTDGLTLCSYTRYTPMDVYIALSVGDLGEWESPDSLLKYECDRVRTFLYAPMYTSSDSVRGYQMWFDMVTAFSASISSSSLVDEFHRLWLGYTNDASERRFMLHNLLRLVSEYPDRVPVDSLLWNQNPYPELNPPEDFGRLVYSYKRDRILDSLLTYRSSGDTLGAATNIINPEVFIGLFDGITLTEKNKDRTYMMYAGLLMLSEESWQGQFLDNLEQMKESLSDEDRFTLLLFGLYHYASPTPNFGESIYEILGEDWKKWFQEGWWTQETVGELHEAIVGN